MDAEYVYYTEKDGHISFDTVNVGRELAEIGFFVRIRLDLAERSLRIPVPEEIEGRPVSLVGIILQLPKTACIPKLDHPLIRYLYIPSRVRHLRIGTAITLPDGKPDKKRGRFNPLDGCTVEISPDNTQFRAYKNGIYSKDMTKLYYICPQGESFEVPSGVKIIKGGAGCALRGLQRLVIPESVIEISNSAFEDCSELKEAHIHAKNIGQRAFYGCKSLKEIRLPDGLLKVGDYAFAMTGIRKLSIPPRVQLIGQDILKNTDPSNTMLEVYLKDGILPIRRGICPADNGTLLVVRSFETNEILLEFVILGSLDMIFTEHGIDFTEYDDMFKKDKFVANYRFQDVFLAAWVRLRYPFGMDEETLVFFKNYVSEQAELIIQTKIMFSASTARDAAEHPYLHLVDDEGMLRLIDKAARVGKTEITAVLMQKLNERRNRNEEK